MFNRAQDFIESFKAIDFLAPLAIRLYLVPIFWMAGSSKIDWSTMMPKDSVVQWFGGSLGLPFPEIMAILATYTELLGAVFLLFGFAVRWISVPLLVTMAVAAFTVHLDNGWSAIADPQFPLASERVEQSVEKLAAAKSILQEHGNYQWLTSSGNFAIINNGIEFSVTYFIMLLSLFFAGAGKFFSLDYYISLIFRR
ncbi:MAG: putative oxidoreductase [Pseudoalteromonas tetraodonis]|jgi:putative oxidoreductase